MTGCMDWLLSKQVSWRTVLLSVGFAVGVGRHRHAVRCVAAHSTAAGCDEGSFCTVVWQNNAASCCILAATSLVFLALKIGNRGDIRNSIFVPWMLPASMQQCLQDNSYMRLLQCLAGCSRFWLDDVRLPDLDCDLGCVQ